MANERQTAPQSDIKILISKGLEQGYLTYAEVNDHLPDDMVDPEQIEDIIGMINGMGIEVHEVAPDAETLLLAGQSASGREVDDTAAEEAAAALTALDSEGGRTTDPVRMYMREMGTVELLTREGEIAIAKRIEEGLAQMNTALASFPASAQLLLEDYELHKAGKKRLAEIVVGFNDGEPEPVPEPVVIVPDEDAEADDADDAEEATDEADEPGPTGPDPLEVAARMEAMGAAFARFQKAYAKGGPTAKPALKAREDIAEQEATIAIENAMHVTLADLKEINRAMAYGEAKARK
ncbi:MAG: RNA polymerase sigma factor RpoD, partial [Comamonadaceae bacterium]